MRRGRYGTRATFVYIYKKAKRKADCGSISFCWVLFLVHLLYSPLLAQAALAGIITFHTLMMANSKQKLCILAAVSVCYTLIPLGVQRHQRVCTNSTHKTSARRAAGPVSALCLALFCVSPSPCTSRMGVFIFI